MTRPRALAATSSAIITLVLTLGVTGESTRPLSAASQDVAGVTTSSPASRILRWSPSLPLDHSRLSRLPASASPSPPPGSIRLRLLPARTELHADVTLKLPDPSVVTSFIAELSNRRSREFHRFLRRGQFGRIFGPTMSEVNFVESVLRADGLRPGRVTPDRLSIPITASADVLDHAFRVSLVDYRLSDGRIAYSTPSSPQIPSSVVQFVQGIVGLSNLYEPHSLIAHAAAPRPHTELSKRLDARRALGGPWPCSAASHVASTYGSLTANQLASYYAMTPMYGLGDFGQGVNVGLVELEPNSTSDIARYRSCYGLRTSVNYFSVDGGVGSGVGSGEAALDIEDVMGLAPRTTIDVYQAPNSDEYDDFSAIINRDADQVVSASWGECELDAGYAAVQSEGALFDQAATQGQTVLAAAGDTGSTDCLADPGSQNGSSLSVDDPASQPNVLGVGGTTVGSSTENVWNNSGISNGAGGGGISSAWCMPSYQYQKGITGLISGYSQQDATDCGSKTPYLRQVPDVSADADPNTGYMIYHKGQWQAWGGTSAAAPLWAAVAAVVDASPFCSYYGSNVGGDAGVFPQGLYSIMSDGWMGYATYDVTTGNNDYKPSGYTGGMYPATRGYDMASGLGTPLLTDFTASGKPSLFYPGLAAAMCWEYGTKLESTHITSISPRTGPATGGASVTITGSGFLPIVGADMVQLGSKLISASCSSTTRCEAILSPHAPGPQNLRMLVEDLTESPTTSADQYTFVAAPVVSSLTPSSGRTSGGERVTIYGLYLAGTTRVHFGSKLASHLDVLSSKAISVTAPPGQGTVNVTVTSIGGTSKTGARSHYRY